MLANHCRDLFSPVVMCQIWTQLAVIVGGKPAEACCPGRCANYSCSSVVTAWPAFKTQTHLCLVFTFIWVDALKLPFELHFWSGVAITFYKTYKQTQNKISVLNTNDSEKFLTQTMWYICLSCRMCNTVCKTVCHLAKANGNAFNCGVFPQLYEVPKLYPHGALCEKYMNLRLKSDFFSTERLDVLIYAVLAHWDWLKGEMTDSYSISILCFALFTWICLTVTQWAGEYMNLSTQV